MHREPFRSGTFWLKRYMKQSTPVIKKRYYFAWLAVTHSSLIMMLLCICFLATAAAMMLEPEPANIPSKIVSTELENGFYLSCIIALVFVIIDAIYVWRKGKIEIFDLSNNEALFIFPSIIAIVIFIVFAAAYIFSGIYRALSSIALTVMLIGGLLAVGIYFLLIADTNHASLSERVKGLKEAAMFALAVSALTFSIAAFLLQPAILLMESRYAITDAQTSSEIQNTSL